MGKASRNKREKLELRNAEAGQNQKAKKAQKKKVDGGTVIAVVCVVLAALCIAAILTLNEIKTGGVILRRTVAATTENYTVDNAIVSFYFYNEYQNFLETYGDYLSYFNLDTTKSLKVQQSSMSQDGDSWFTYFMDAAVDNLNQILVFCEEANVRGITLTDEDYDAIDEYIDVLYAEAKAVGMPKLAYIRAMFGAGMKEKDVRRALELNMLATKARNAMIEEYSYTEADYEAYIEENPTALLHLSYATMSLSTADGMTEGDITTDILNEFRPKFETVTSLEEYNVVAYDYLKDYAYKDHTDKTDEDIQAEIEGFVVENAVYSEGDFMKWALEEGNVGDPYVTMSEDGTALYAYILLAKPALQEYDSVNVRHILFTTDTYGTIEAATAKAEEILAEWKAGDATAESFGVLADKYSEDSAEAGLYENVIKGNMVDAFNDWIFADGRVAGDSGIVETEYGMHIIYLEGYGLAAWQVEAENALMEADYAADVNALGEKYLVTVDEIALAMIEA